MGSIRPKLVDEPLSARGGARGGCVDSYAVPKSTDGCDRRSKHPAIRSRPGDLDDIRSDVAVGEGPVHSRGYRQPSRCGGEAGQGDGEDLVRRGQTGPDGAADNVSTKGDLGGIINSVAGKNVSLDPDRVSGVVEVDPIEVTIDDAVADLGGEVASCVLGHPLVGSYALKHASAVVEGLRDDRVRDLDPAVAEAEDLDFLDQMVPDDLGPDIS